MTSSCRCEQKLSHLKALCDYLNHFFGPKKMASAFRARRCHHRCLGQAVVCLDSELHSLKD